MKRILLTGMSGVGKSTVIEQLAARGERAVDFDQPGWSVHSADGDWIWNERRVGELLDAEHPGTLFVSGCAENQGKFYSKLDEIVLLSAPREVMIDRLRTRTNNQYGKSPEELELVMYYLETVEPLIRRGATREIDTSVPLNDVVEQLLEIAGTGSQA